MGDAQGRVGGLRNGLKRHAEVGAIDTFVQAWVAEGLSRGFSFEALAAAFEKARASEGTERQSPWLVVVHSDRRLAAILAAEIQEAIGADVSFAGLEEAIGFEGSLILTTASASAAVSKVRPEGHKVIALKSIEEVLTGLGRPAAPVLIGIVSRSETILKWSALLIPALGLAGGEAIQFNPERPDWQRGLGACDVVAADVLAARELPKTTRPIVIRLVSDAFLVEVRGLVTAEKV